MTEHSRQKQEEYAETIDTDHIGLFLTCDTEELEHRITLRTEKNDSASDAGIDILKKFLKTYKEGHIQDWININANKTQDKVLSDVLKILKIPSHMHSLSKPSRFPKRSL